MHTALLHRRHDLRLLMALTSLHTPALSLLSSPICHHNEWSSTPTPLPYSSTVVTGFLDQIIPTRHFVRRSRSSDHWFNSECRDAKTLTRQLRRVYSAAMRSAVIFYIPTAKSPASATMTRAGVISSVATVIYSTRSAAPTGRAGSRLTELHQNDSRVRLTHSSVVASHHLAQQSASKSSTATSMFVDPLKAHPTQFTKPRLWAAVFSPVCHRDSRRHFFLA